MTTYRIESCNDHNRWDEFVSRSGQGNIFCMTKFLELWNSKYELFFVLEKSNPILGAIVADCCGGNYSNPFLYQGILLEPWFESGSNHRKIKKYLDVTEFLLEELKKNRSEIRFSLHHSIDDLRPFQWFHYHTPNENLFSINLKYTGILPLTSSSTFGMILRKASSERQRIYRRCEEEGYTVEVTDDIGILNSLHEKTFNRQGLKRMDGERILATTIAKAAVSKGFGRLMVCRDSDGTPASASLFLLDDKCGYYIIGANNPDYRKSGAGTAVVFQQIKKCFEEGLEKVDFVGINSPERGFFKTSFGLEVSPYFEVVWKKLSENSHKSMGTVKDA